MLENHVLDSVLDTLLFDNAQRGSDAYYWHIQNTTWGVKFFEDDSDRDENYMRQYEAFELGVAPQLGDKVECEIEGQLMFGFITEHVDCYRDLLFKAYDLPSNYKDCTNAQQKMKWCEVCDGVLESPSHLDKYEVELTDKIEALDGKIANRLLYDFHPGNWGITKAGVPVLLDFSRQGSIADVKTF